MIKISKRKKKIFKIIFKLISAYFNYTKQRDNIIEVKLAIIN